MHAPTAPQDHGAGHVRQLGHLVPLEDAALAHEGIQPRPLVQDLVQLRAGGQGAAGQEALDQVEDAVADALDAGKAAKLAVGLVARGRA